MHIFYYLSRCIFDVITVSPISTTYSLMYLCSVKFCIDRSILSVSFSVWGFILYTYYIYMYEHIKLHIPWCIHRIRFLYALIFFIVASLPGSIVYVPMSHTRRFSSHFFFYNFTELQYRFNYSNCSSLFLLYTSIILYMTPVFFFFIFIF